MERKRTCRIPARHEAAMDAASQSQLRLRSEAFHPPNTMRRSGRQDDTAGFLPRKDLSTEEKFCMRLVCSCERPSLSKVQFKQTVPIRNKIRQFIQFLRRKFGN